MKIISKLFLLSVSLLFAIAPAYSQQWYDLTETKFINRFIGNEPNSDDFTWTGEDWANQEITQSDGILSITNFGRKYANINLEFNQTLNISNNPVVYFEAKCTDTVSMQMRLIDTDGQSTWQQFIVKFSDADDFVIYEIPVDISWAKLEKIIKVNFSRSGLETVECDVQFRYLALGTTKYTELGQYKLDAQTTQGGRIEFDPPGGIYEKGTEVTLTAITEENYQFDGWTGDLTSTEQEITITVDGDKSVLANFSPIGSDLPNFYVAQNHPDASDENPGTLDKPFLTIQKAALMAEAGDTVFVREGVYRETITPANSGNDIKPIVYMPYNNEDVTISGTEEITGWTKHEGSIYKAEMAGNFFQSQVNMTDQVFVDGQMMNLARWPNTSLNVSYPVKAMTNKFVSKSKNETTNITTGVMIDDDIPAGDYAGAEIFFQPNNNAWSWAFSGEVESVEGNTITFTSFSSSGKDFGQDVYDPKSRYYIFNKLSLLDTAGEWFHDTENELLYIWLPDNENPEDHIVEAKKRDYGFNLSKLSFIEIKGFKIFGCNITTDDVAGGNGKGYNEDGTVRYPWRGAGSVAESHHVTIDGITCLYPSHSTDMSGHFFFQYGGHSGIVLSGEDHCIQNSIIRYSFANAISVLGNRHKILNNLIEDIAYSGCEYGAIGQAASLAYDCEMAYNTIRRTGRSGIRLGFRNSDPNNLVARVHHNEISDFMLQDWDGGGIYHGGDGKFLRIDHNIIHDGHGFIVSGIYPDWGKNYIYDHNVIYNVWANFQFTHNYNQEGFNNMLVYNNTAICTNNDGFVYGPFNFVVSGEQKGNHIKNNIGWVYTPPAASSYKFWSDAETFETQEKSNNLYDTDPLFVNYPDNFQLTENSPAIDAGEPMETVVIDGVEIPPFNDPTQGQMDIGAYEFGLEPFQAGSTLDDTKGSTITIYAAGKNKDETMVVMLRSNPVAVFNNVAGDFDNKTTNEYSFVADGEITPDMVQVWLDQNNENQALFVDKISIDGETYQSEDVFCSCTNDDTEYLECEGYFHYKIRPKFTLTITADNGTVILDPPGGVYNDGTRVTLTAQPDEGYVFVEWGGSVSGTVSPKIINVNRDREIIATFQEGTFVEDMVSKDNLNFRIYPNPVSNSNFTVQCSKAPVSKTILTIVDLNGTVLHKTRILKKQQTIALPKNMAKGMYLIKMKTNTSQIIRKISVY